MILRNFPDDRILDWSKLKAFADKLKVAQMMKLPFDMVEIIAGKVENGGYIHSLLFTPQYLQKLSSSGLLKVRFVCKKVEPNDVVKKSYQVLNLKC